MLHLVTAEAMIEEGKNRAALEEMISEKKEPRNAAADSIYSRTSRSSQRSWRFPPLALLASALTIFARSR
jgi:hypothetical protein